MGDACSPKNLAAILKASDQIEGLDFFTEAQNKAGMNETQNFYYEDHMVKAMGIKKGFEPDANPYDPRTYGEIKPSDVKEGKRTFSEEVKQSIEKTKGLAVGVDRLFGNVNEVLPEQFWKPILNAHNKWEAKGDGGIQSFRNEVGKPAGRVLNDLDKAMKSGDNLEQQRVLKKLGIQHNQVSEAREYLKWVRDGAYLQKGVLDRLPILPHMVTVSSKTMANMNLSWTLFNGPDLQRMVSHFTAKHGIQNPERAIKAAIDEMGPMALLKTNPRFEKMGIYKSNRLELTPSKMDAMDPFSASVKAQKNAVAYMAEAAGIDPVIAVGDLVFDPHPMLSPRVYRMAQGTGGRMIFSLVRFTAGETRYYIKEATRALAGDRASQKNVALWAVSRAYLFGAATVLPVGIPVDREWIRELEDKTGMNLMRRTSNGLFNIIGIDAELNMPDFIRPGDFVPLGVRSEILKRQATDVSENAVATFDKVTEGDMAAAATHALVTGSALMNLGLFYNKLPVLTQSPLNSTQITKMFKTHAKALEDEYSEERYQREMLKSFAGRNIKKPKDDKPTTVQGRRSRRSTGRRSAPRRRVAQ